MKAPAMANPGRLRPRVELHEDHVRIAATPGTAVLGLKGTFLLPYSVIERAEPLDQAPWPGLLARRVGLHAPGVSALGHFWVDDEHRYYAFHRGDPVLELQLRAGAPFDRVAIAHPDPAAAATAIQNAVRRESASELHTRDHEGL